MPRSDHLLVRCLVERRRCAEVGALEVLGRLRREELDLEPLGRPLGRPCFGLGDCFCSL